MSDYFTLDGIPESQTHITIGEPVSPEMQGFYWNVSPTPQAFGKVVACEPFPNMTVEKEIRNGVALPKQKGTTTALTVVFQSGRLEPGTRVLVRSEAFVHGWAKEVFQYKDTKFILVPEEFVLLVDSRSHQ